MLKIRRPLGRLIFNMGIAIPGKTVFLIETAPWSPPYHTLQTIGLDEHHPDLENTELAQFLVALIIFECGLVFRFILDFKVYACYGLQVKRPHDLSLDSRLSYCNKISQKRSLLSWLRVLNRVHYNKKWKYSALQYKWSVLGIDQEPLVVFDHLPAQQNFNLLLCALLDTML